MNDSKIHVSDKTGVPDNYFETFLRNLSKAMDQTGGCDGTDKMTKRLLAKLSYNEHSAEVIDCLNSQKYDCDCMALNLLLRRSQKHYPLGIWPLVVVTDPFCESHKKKDPHLKIAMEKIAKNMNALELI